MSAHPAAPVPPADVVATAPPRPVAPPPCWCGRLCEGHATPDHDYAPADGTESEAYDAW